MVTKSDNAVLATNILDVLDDAKNTSDNDNDIQIVIIIPVPATAEG